MMRSTRLLAAAGLGVLLGGCSGALRQELRDPAPEFVGLLSPDGFVPCGEAGADVRWLAHYHGPASRQFESLKNSGLLSLPRPLRVRVTGRVTESRRNAFPGGYSGTIAVTDVLGMWLSGDCESEGQDFRRITRDGSRSEGPAAGR